MPPPLTQVVLDALRREGVPMSVGMLIDCCPEVFDWTLLAWCRYMYRRWAREDGTLPKLPHQREGYLYPAGMVAYRKRQHQWNNVHKALERLGDRGLVTWIRTDSLTGVRYVAR